MLKHITKMVLLLIPRRLIRAALLALSFEFRRRASEELGRGSAEIKEGLFAGGWVRKSPWSSTQYWPAQVVGVYESVVMEFISTLGPLDTVIDLGAAEGFYAINLRSTGIAKKVIAFDSDQAAINVMNVAVEQLKIENFELRGTATFSEVKSSVLEEGPGNNLLISDIEGAEFELFSEELIQSLENWSVIIELHESGVLEASQTLKRKFMKTHFAEIAIGGELKIQKLHELFPKFTQLEIANLAHEGRSSIQHWLFARPKAAI
jgi:hypothetical protein